MKIGIIKKSSDAKSKSQVVDERDKIEAEIINSYDKRGILKVDTLKGNLLSGLGSEITIEGESFPIIVKYEKGNSYTIDSEGNVHPYTPSE